MPAHVRCPHAQAGERKATGTSLSAIVLIASTATIAQDASGNVKLADGLLVGTPAVGGVLRGTWAHQQARAGSQGNTMADDG